VLRPRVGAALLAVQVFFGVHYFAAKLALGMVPARAWATLRIVAAALLLLGWQLLRRRGMPPRHEWGRLALFSLFGITINQLLFAEGLSRTTPSHSAILNSLIPVMTLVIAMIVRHERATPARIGAVAVSFVSVLVLLRVESFRLDDRLVVGDLLTLANAASFSLYLVMSRRAMRRMDPLGATAVILGFGALGVSAVGAPALAQVPFATLPVRFWLLMGYAVVFATVVCYGLNAYALSHTDSSMVALFIYLQPPIATALSMIFLGERPDLRFWIAALGVFAGVGLAIRAHAAERRSRPGDTSGGAYTRFDTLAPGEP